MARPALSLRRVLLVAFVLALIVAPARTATAVASREPNGWTLKRIDLPVTAAAYVAPRGIFVATVGPYNAFAGNSLVEMHPASGALGRVVPVGGTPTTLAISDDGLVAYVGLLDTNKIVQVDLVTFIVTRTFTTFVDEYRALTGIAGDLVVPPGRNDTVVALLEDRFLSPGFRRVMAFRDGVALANHVDSYDIDKIEMIDATTVYGSGQPFTVLMSLDDDGLSTTRAVNHFNDLSVHYGNFMKAVGDKVVTESGRLVDPISETTLQNYAAVGFVAPDAANNRVTYVDRWSPTANSYWLTFVQYNLTTGEEIGRHDFFDQPAGVDLVASPTNVLYIGDHRLAEYRNSVYLAGPAVVPGVVPTGNDAPSAVALYGETVLPYKVADLHFDLQRAQLYATVESGSTKKASTLLALNPVTGRVVRVLPFDSSPGPMAVSDDNTTMYVGLGANGNVARVDLRTFTEVSRFNLGPSDYPGDTLYAHDIEVRPGTVDTVAIAQGAPGSPIHKGVALFVDGERRPEVTPTHTGPDFIEFRDADTLYGNGWIMRVDETGVTRVKDLNFGWGDFVIDPFGRTWSDDGFVYDPIAMQTVGAVGHPGLMNFTAGVAPVVIANRAYQVRVGHPAFDGTQLWEFDATTFRRLGTKQLSSHGTGRNVAWTGVGLAAQVDEGLALLSPAVCAGLNATLVGTGTITGTPGNDVIVGSPGNDVIDGLGGKDIICGVAGNDVLRGGTGNDTLFGGTGNDDLVGGDGNDTVLLGDDATFRRVDLDNVADDGITGEKDNVRSSNEVIVGGPGSDYIVGGAGSQVLRGGAGNDMLLGLAGNDGLDGGEGADKLYGGAGNDAIVGGVGADYCHGADGDNHVSLCEAG